MKLEDVWKKHKPSRALVMIVLMPIYIMIHIYDLLVGFRGGFKLWYAELIDYFLIMIGQDEKVRLRELNRIRRR